MKKVKKTESNIWADMNTKAMSLDEAISKARKWVEEAENISALTGAGISVDSGIPDFRSEGGLWEKYNPNEYATYDSFMRDPSKFWEMGQELAEVILDAHPNEAHRALAKLEERSKLLGIITQNIDNLHQEAGNQKVVELHGNYLRAYCLECGKKYVGEKIQRRVVEGEIPPKCDECDGILKSEAILFGEPLPQEAMSEAIRICRKTDLMLVIGTSLQVYPAAYLPHLAKKSDARIILVNLHGNNRKDVADILLEGRAADIMPQIV